MSRPWRREARRWTNANTGDSFCHWTPRIVSKTLMTISRLAFYSHGEVGSIVLEEILALLGVAACALVLIAFWGTDPLGMRRHRSADRHCLLNTVATPAIHS